MPKGGAKRFERKSLKVFSVELALGPLEKIREGISLEEHEHSPPAPPPKSFYYKFTDVASRRLSFPRRFSIDSTGWLSRGNFAGNFGNVRERLARSWTGPLLTETERKPIPRRVRSIVRIDSLHHSCSCYSRPAIDSPLLLREGKNKTEG